MLIKANYHTQIKSKYECDRCHKRITVKEKHTILHQGFNQNPRKYCDLCDKCMRALDRGLEKEKSNHIIKRLKESSKHGNNIENLEHKKDNRKRFDYSEEKSNFLADNVIGISLEELTNKFNLKFKCNFSQKEIQSMKNHLNLTSGIDTKWKKEV